jgi:hypothetical protein
MELQGLWRVELRDLEEGDGIVVEAMDVGVLSK